MEDKMSKKKSIAHAVVLTAAVVGVASVAAIGPSTAAAEGSPLGPPPGTYKILSDDGTITIPFEMFRDDIRMMAEINGRPVRMLIDNGYLWDQLLFFGSPRVDSLGLDYDGDVEVSGSGDGAQLTSKTASGVTITFPGVEFADQAAIVTPYIPGALNLWEGAEGQVSANFFKHFVVDINFDDSVITLIAPDEFRYDGGGREVPLKHLGHGAWGIPSTLEMSDGSVISRLLMLDLGLGDALWFAFEGVGGIPLPATTIETSLGYGIQGEIEGYVGRVRTIQIGDYQFDDVLAGFSPAAEGDSVDFDDAMIGMALFSQFNIVFDYPGHRMFLEPNKRYGAATEYNMTGLEWKPARGGFEVERIIPSSPASEAGLEVGDLIARINGRPTGDYKFWDLQPVFRERGATVTLEYSRNGETREAVLVLRRVI
jgi:hypothetical protein